MTGKVNFCISYRSSNMFLFFEHCILALVSECRGGQLVEFGMMAGAVNETVL
jgi:hypothetical protein